jgi:hypothetical protein
MITKANILIILIFYFFFACNNKSDPKFFISDMSNLKGNWMLTEIGLIDKKNTLFSVDSTNYNFKKLSIDIDKMNFHLTSYPFKNFEPSFPISISNDTIFILSGTTIDNELVMLKKNSFVYKFSDDHKLLQLLNLEDKIIMIFSRNQIIRY